MRGKIPFWPFETYHVKYFGVCGPLFLDSECLLTFISIAHEHRTS